MICGTRTHLSDGQVVAGRIDGSVVHRRELVAVSGPLVRRSGVTAEGLWRD